MSLEAVWADLLSTGSNESQMPDPMEVLGYSIESIGGNVNQILSFLTAVQKRFDVMVKDGVSFESVRQYEHDIVLTMEAAGIELPSALIVPSFEAEEKTEAAATEKKDNILKRGYAEVKRWIERLIAWVKSWFTKKKDDIKKDTDTLKLEVKKAEETANALALISKSADKAPPATAADRALALFEASLGKEKKVDKDAAKKAAELETEKWEIPLPKEYGNDTKQALAKMRKDAESALSIVNGGTVDTDTITKLLAAKATIKAQLNDKEWAIVHKVTFADMATLGEGFENTSLTEFYGKMTTTLNDKLSKLGSEVSRLEQSKDSTAEELQKVKTEYKMVQVAIEIVSSILQLNSKLIRKVTATMREVNAKVEKELRDSKK